MPAARAAVQAVPALRALLRRSGVQAAKALPLTPELLTGTLEASLRRLGTDHLDLYALHGVAAAALTEPVLRALEDIRAAGKARAVAVASDAEAGLAAIGIGAPFGVVQAALPAPGAADALLPAARAAGFGAIVHSVFGIEGSLRGAQGARRRRPGLPRGGASAGQGTGGISTGRWPRRLLARAFALNPDGVVLVSMFSGQPGAEPRRRRGAAADDADLLDRLALHTPSPERSGARRRQAKSFRATGPAWDVHGAFRDLPDRTPSGRRAQELPSGGSGGIARAPVGARPPDVAPHAGGLGEARAAAQPRERVAADHPAPGPEPEQEQRRAAAARPGSAGGSSSPAPSAS